MCHGHYCLFTATHKAAHNRVARTHEGHGKEKRHYEGHHEGLTYPRLDPFRVTGTEVLRCEGGNREAQRHKEGYCQPVHACGGSVSGHSGGTQPVEGHLNRQRTDRDDRLLESHRQPDLQLPAQSRRANAPICPPHVERLN